MGRQWLGLKEQLRHSVHACHWWPVSIVLIGAFVESWRGSSVVRECSECAVDIFRADAFFVEV